MDSKLAGIVNDTSLKQNFRETLRKLLKSYGIKEEDIPEAVELLVNKIYSNGAVQTGVSGLGVAPGQQ